MNITIRRQNRRGSAEWVVDYRVNGVRKRLIRASRAQAEAEAATIRSQVDSAGRAWLILSPVERTDLMMVYQEIQSAGRTLREVWDAFKSHNHVRTAVPLKVGLESFLASRRAGGYRPRYVESLESYLALFARGREEAAIHSITPQTIGDWFDGRKESLSARRSNTGRLSAFFTHAKRQGWTHSNPCDALEPIRLEAHPPKILTVQQARDVLAWTVESKPRFLPWLVLALFAGIRPEELDRLSWRDIDLTKGVAVVSGAASKVRQRRIVPLCPSAVLWLRLCQARRLPMPIPLVTRRRAMRFLRSKLGWKAWPQDILRHSAASYAIARDQDASKVALALGNSPGILLRNYREIVSQDDAKAFFDLSPGLQIPPSPCTPFPLVHINLSVQEREAERHSSSS